MTRRGRDPRVRRYLRVPIVWAGIGVLLFLVTTAAGIDAAALEHRRLDRGLKVIGTVAPDYDGGNFVAVEYLNPRTEDHIKTNVVVLHDAALPRAGEVIRLDVDRSDPRRLRIHGDRISPFADIWANLILAIVPLLLVLTRWWSVVRTERLARSPATTFAMFGVVAPPSRFERRCRLHLYALDGGSGATPICTVPLLTTAGLPLADGHVLVDVKGRPRAFGRVVARVGDAIIWPAGRARRTARVPMPATRLERPTMLPVAARPPVDARERRRCMLRDMSAETLLLCAGGALLLAGLVTTVTARNAHDSNDLRQHGAPVIAMVTDHNDDAVGLAWSIGGRTATGRVNSDDPAHYPIGERVPAHVERAADSSRVILDAEPYNSVLPISLAVVPVVGAVFAAAWMLMRGRLAVRAATREPVYALAVWRPHSSEKSVLLGQVANGARLTQCTIDVPWSDFGPYPWESRWAVIAGTAEPDGALAVWIDDRLVFVGLAGAGIERRDR